MRVLSLTSPPMKGNDVKVAQRRLRAFGAWSGKIDGVFGEQTARACTQAKWMLGYAEKNIRPTYGTDLNAYLSDAKKPTLLMQQRAKNRKPKNLGEAGFDGIVNVVRNSLEVEKFNVGCCMERFFEDNDFSWSENEDDNEC